MNNLNKLLSPTTGGGGTKVHSKNSSMSLKKTDCSTLVYLKTLEFSLHDSILLPCSNNLSSKGWGGSMGHFYKESIVTVLSFVAHACNPNALVV